MGTSVFGMIYITVAVVVAILGAWFLVSLWLKYLKAINLATENRQSLPNPIGQIIVSVISVSAYLIVVTLGWSVLQSATGNMSQYQSPAEIAEQKAVSESQLPSNDQLDATAAEQKQRAQVKPHEEALSDYEAAMERQAQKIKERSLGNTPAEDSNK